MRVQVDETRRDDQATGFDGLSGITEVAPDSDDRPCSDADISNGVMAAFGVDDAATSDQRVVHRALCPVR